ncbi:hypothetical protein Gpo141_00009481 [Globisporangium polare]
MDELWRSEDAAVAEVPVSGSAHDAHASKDASAIELKEKLKEAEKTATTAETEEQQLEQQLTVLAPSSPSSASNAKKKKKRQFDEVEPVVWHLSHRPSGEKTRKKLTLRDDIAQIGFGGCGGMYNYFLGVASVLQEEYDLENVIFSGVSAGCFPAMVLALGMDVKEFFFKENIPLIEHAATCSYSGLGKWIPLVKANTLKMLPKDAYKMADKKLYFSVTEIPALKNHVITTWESNEDMVDCMLSSGHVPLYTDSLVANYRGKKFVDGGLSNNFPIVHPDRPHKMLQIWKWRWISPTWVLVTTSANWALEMFRMGREDALKHLHEIEDAFFPKHAAKRTKLA